MKKALRYSINFVLVVLSLFLFVSCSNNEGNKNDASGHIDFVGQTKLTRDFKGKSFKKDGIGEVKLANAVDGDTIHVFDENQEKLQLRFSGVDTPESTGSIEPWGKKASKFTASKVENTTSIVIECDAEDGKVETDSNGRYLTWIWYLDAATNEYRLLNLELVQEGYSYGKSKVLRYKDVITKAHAQSVKERIKVFGEKDKDFSEDRKEIDLKTLREDLTKNGQKSEYLNGLIAIEAVVTRIIDRTAFVQDIDKETGEIYSIQVFMGYNYYDKIQVGNRVLFVGSCVFYDVAQTYQLTNIQDTGLGSSKDLKLISENNPVVPETITPDKLVTTDTNLIYNLVKIENATVKSVYVTNTVGSSKNGAMTLTCEANGITFTVRTERLIVKNSNDSNIITNENGLVLKETFENKTISVSGIVELYDGKYQLKLGSIADCEFIA